MAGSGAGNGDKGTAEAEAYSFLLAKIRGGRLTPGMRIRAEEIAGEIGMSRMPVREALRRLDSEGLVTLRPNRGAVVAGYDGQEIQELFEMRSVLEGLAARLATARADEDNFEEMHALMARMARSEGDGDRWIARHWAFHRYLCELSSRPRLVREIERLHTLLEPYLRLWLAHVEKPLNTVEDHTRIVAAIESGDPATAEAVMKEHVLETSPDIIAYLSTRAD